MREMKPEQEDSREIKDELQLPEEEKPGFWGDSLADSGETDTDEKAEAAYYEARRQERHERIPVKTEIKAEVSGLYIVGVKGIHGTLEAPVKKKKGFFARFKKDKAPEVQSQPKQSGKSAKNTKTAAANTNTTDKKNKKKK